MKQVMDFLRELSLNNEKPWFEAHKQEYLLAKATVSSLTLKLLEGIHEFDDTIGPLTVSDCTYRIYRDLRFSKDKSPYKTHMGIFITRGGKKSGYSGYYFHIDGSGNHLIAIGNYYTEPRVLKTLREDIELGGGDFRRIIEGLDPCLELETEGSLKNVPKGFPADSPGRAAGFHIQDREAFPGLCQQGDRLLPGRKERVFHQPGFLMVPSADPLRCHTDRLARAHQTA